MRYDVYWQLQIRHGKVCKERKDALGVRRGEGQKESSWKKRCVGELSQ